MEILGFTLKPDYQKGLDYLVYKNNKLVGIITFVWGYVKVLKCISKNGISEEVPLANYYYWDKDKWEYQYPPGSKGLKLILKCLRRLKFSLFIDKILLRN